MNNKLTVIDFRKRGGALVSGDIISKEDGSLQMTIKNKCHADQLNKPDHSVLNYITSFAPRENTCAQPVPDDFPVVVLWSDGLEEVTEARFVSWGHDRIESWMPNINALIAEQVTDVMSPVFCEVYREIHDDRLTCKKGTPAPKAMYTKAMADAGEPIQVGMMFMLSNGDNMKALFVTDEEVVFMVDGELEIEDVNLIKPAKTTEEIKREIALQAQWKDTAKYLYDVTSNPLHHCKDIASLLQKTGRLREV